MNKSVFSWSSVVLIVGVLLVAAPSPISWFSPVFTIAAWLLLLRALPKRPVAQTIEAAVQVTKAEPPTVPMVEFREVLPESLEDDVQRYKASLEVLLGFKDLVVKDTETAVLRITEALFTLVNNSKELSLHIERSLSYITDGDSGLRKTMKNLEEQVGVFEALASHFTRVKEGLAADIESLTTAVGSINQFSETLSDLADQTNVLAINASIEAARVGIHGRGFAVIATQVQTLSKNSKTIAETMARTVRDVVTNVETSFNRQSQRIGEAEILIVRSEDGLKKWSNQVEPQLVEVGTMISHSRGLSQNVTSELGDVTVSLQFQDRTRQILDHMAEVLVAASASVVRSAGLESKKIPSKRRDEAFQEASRHFTVKDEWALIDEGKAQELHGSKTVELF